MRTDWLIEKHQIAVLGHFLDLGEEDIAREIEQIEQLASSRGEIEDLNDLEARYDYPLGRAEMTTKAVLYELNAIVESRLHDMAEPLWRSSTRFSGPKSLDEISDYAPRSLKTLRSVSDERFSIVVSLVEEAVSVSLPSLAGWSAYLSLRECVNALKHRQGRRRWHEVASLSEESGTLSSTELFHEAGFDTARDTLRIVESLLKELRQLESAAGHKSH